MEWEKFDRNNYSLTIGNSSFDFYNEIEDSLNGFGYGLIFRNKGLERGRIHMSVTDCDEDIPEVSGDFEKIISNLNLIKEAGQLDERNNNLALDHLIESLEKKNFTLTLKID